MRPNGAPTTSRDDNVDTNTRLRLVGTFQKHTDIFKESIQAFTT